MFEDVADYVKMRECMVDGTHVLHFTQLQSSVPMDSVSEAFLTFPTSVWRTDTGQTDEQAQTWSGGRTTGLTLMEMRQLSARSRVNQAPSSAFLLSRDGKQAASSLTTE
jgi:hypothetical protein